MSLRSRKCEYENCTCKSYQGSFRNFHKADLLITAVIFAVSFAIAINVTVVPVSYTLSTGETIVVVVVLVVVPTPLYLILSSRWFDYPERRLIKAVR